jgi:hypothetical protein
MDLSVIENLDIGVLNLSLKAIFAYCVLLALGDTFFNVLLSFKNGNFSAIYVADFIRTHIVLRVFAIGFLAILGNGVPVLEMPAIPIVTDTATLALGAYLIETIASLREGTKSTAPVPTPPTPTPEG